SPLTEERMRICTWTVPWVLAIAAGCGPVNPPATLPKVPAEFGRVNLNTVTGDGPETRGNPIVVLRASFVASQPIPGEQRRGNLFASYQAVRWKVVEVESGQWNDP